MKPFLIALALCFVVVTLVVYAIFSKPSRERRIVVVPTATSEIEGYGRDVTEILSAATSQMDDLRHKKYNEHYSILEYEKIIKLALDKMRALTPPDKAVKLHSSTLAAFQSCIREINNRVDFMDDSEASLVMLRCGNEIFRAAE